MDDTSVYIMDVYNRGIYPHDGYAKSKYLRHNDIHFNFSTFIDLTPASSGV